MQRISPFRIILTLAVSLIALAAFAPKAHADSIAISPPEFELFANPGDTLSDKIKVTNNDPTPVVLQSTVEDFTAAGDTGGINIDTDPNAPSTNYSLARWVTVEPSSFTVPANGTTVISYTIKVPQGAEPGGKYASVLITQQGQAVNGGASVNSTIGSLLLLRVSGAVTESLGVDLFKSSDSYYQHGPVSIELRSKNTGNVHVEPTGTIVITNIFGKKVAELPLTEANVLPGAFRAVYTSWSNVPFMGRFTATLVANYGETNQKIAASTSFTVIPVWVIIVVILVIALIVLLIGGRKRIKRLINRLTSD